MKKLITASITILVILLTVSMGARAQMMEGDEPIINEPVAETHQSLDKVLSDLLAQYNVTTIRELECDKLNDDDFEALGEGWMETMHPGTAHERMDEMMALRQSSGQGGEGSQSLRAAHIQMGKNYLGCSDLTKGGMGMMSGGMHGFGMMSGFGMMAPLRQGYAGQGNSMMNSGTFGSWSTPGTLTWLALLVFLVTGSVYFWKQIRK